MQNQHSRHLKDYLGAKLLLARWLRKMDKVIEIAGQWTVDTFCLKVCSSKADCAVSGRQMHKLQYSECVAPLLGLDVFCCCFDKYKHKYKCKHTHILKSRPQRAGDTFCLGPVSTTSVQCHMAPTLLAPHTKCFLFVHKSHLNQFNHISISICKKWHSKKK